MDMVCGWTAWGGWVGGWVDMVGGEIERVC